MEQCLVLTYSQQTTKVMKRSIKLLSFITILLLMGCQDDPIVGPPGPPGEDGLNGEDGLIGTVFEYEVDFTGPEYEAFLGFPNDFTIYESDKMLVYILWDITEDDVDIWRQVPQTILTDNGIFQYNFDFTFEDVRVFMESEFSFDLLTSADTDNQIFRVVVVPADFLESARFDFSDYETVTETFGFDKVMRVE